MSTTHRGVQQMPFPLGRLSPSASERLSRLAVAPCSPAAFPSPGHALMVASAAARFSDHGFWLCPRRSSRRAGCPANLTSGGTVSRPLSRIRDGRAPRRAAPLCEDGAVRPHAKQRRRPLGSVWSGYRLGASSQIRRADHEAGFIVVPSGTTPCVTNRHRAISSLRANATIITFRTRVPVAPARLRYQCTRAEPGW